MPDDDPQRLLAVSHEASQTGAPIVLAGLLGFLHQTTDVSIHTLLIDDGPLRPRFEAVGTVSAVTDQPGAEALGFIERGLRARGALRARRIPAAIRYKVALAPLGRFDVTYLNSLTTLDVLPNLNRSGRVLAHIHEGPMTIAAWQRSHAPKPRNLERVDRWIAVGEETAESLGSVPGIDPDHVIVHYPFIDVASVRARTVTADELDALRRSLGIPQDALIVVGSGTIERRKGPDLFVQLACEIRRRRRDGERPVHFLWVGGDLAGLDWAPLQADLRRTQADHVHVTGHVAEPLPLFRLGDVFVLTSREDPFPLVCLEHAALEVPVVAYDSSGIRAFLADAGPLAAEGIVAYLDVSSMADRVLALLASPARSHEAGAQLAAAVTSRHDIAGACAAIASEIGF